MSREKIELLRELVWGEDIPSPACPEYREHHESIQKILKFIDTELLAEEINVEVYIQIKEHRVKELEDII